MKSLNLTGLKQQVEINPQDLSVLMKCLLGVLIACVVYAFVICDYVDWDSKYSSVFSLVLIPLIGSLSILFMLKTHYKLSDFGFKFANKMKTLRESIVISIIVIIVGILVKIIMIQFNADYSSLSVFSFDLAYSRFEKPVEWYVMVGYPVLYVVFVPFQEVAIRGMLQSLLYRNLGCLGNKQRAFFSIVLPNVVFAFTHLHLSVPFALTALVLGLVWGYLYNRNHSLVSVIVCHSIVGLVLVFVIGFIG